MAALVEPAITATVNNDPKAARNGWTSPKVLYWLECLAVNQRDHAKGSEYDILLPDLWSLGGRFLPRWLLPAAFAAAGIVCGALAVSWRPIGLGVTAAGLLALAAVAANPYSTVERVVDPRTPAGRASLRSGLLPVGLAAGLAFGLAGGLVLGSMFGLLVLGLAAGLAGEPGGTRNCSQLMTQCLAYTLRVGLGGGLVLGNGATWFR